MAPLTRCVVESSGFADGPAEALVRRLLDRGVAVTEISHPLVAEGGSEHLVTDHAPDGPALTRRLARPNRPPLTYPLDLVTPVRTPRADVWFGFNNLAAARGIAHRAARRVDKVVYWAVDFVPDRFGQSVLTKAYDRLDRAVCTRADLRVELSQAAADGRSARLGLRGPDSAPVRIVPMGAWLDRVPKVVDANHDARRVAFLGHLVPRMGVGILLDAVAALVSHDVDVAVDVIGGGPLLDSVRRRVADEGLGGHVTCHGFVAAHEEVERILASATVAVAPYEPDPSSFTRFADPGKLKAYLGAGLPILLTDVPPNAHELAASGGAEIVAPTGAALAAGIRRLFEDREEWRSRRDAAQRYARRFDWPMLLDPLLAEISGGSPTPQDSEA